MNHHSFLRLLLRLLVTPCVCIATSGLLADELQSHATLHDWQKEVTAADVLQLRPGIQSDQPPVITALAIQPGGTVLAAAGDDHLVRLWDMKRGVVLHTMEGHRDWVHAAQFTSDGQTLVTGGADGRAICWDVAAGTRSHELVRDKKPIKSIRLTHDNTRLLMVGYRCPLCLIDYPSGTENVTRPCPCRDMSTLAMSPDGHLAAAAGRNGKIRVWSVSAMEHLFELSSHGRRVRAVCFSGDSRQLVSAGDDRTIRCWDMSNGELVAVASAGPVKLMSLVVTPSGMVAAGGSDNVIRLWELDTLRPAEQLVGHTGSVSALAVDGDRLVSGGFDATIRVWRLPSRDRMENEARRTELPVTR